MRAHLLIMLGIVVAACLMWTYDQQRQQGARRACVSNLKNIGTALEMYSLD